MKLTHLCRRIYPPNANTHKHVNTFLLKAEVKSYFHPKPLGQHCLTACSTQWRYMGHYCHLLLGFCSFKRKSVVNVSDKDYTTYHCPALQLIVTHSIEVAEQKNEYIYSITIFSHRSCLALKDLCMDFFFQFPLASLHLRSK